MIVAIPVEESGKVTTLFGPAPGFFVVDTETGERRFIKNIYACGGCSEGCGEGKSVADLLAEEGVEALLIAGLSQSPLLKLMRRGIVVYRLPPHVKEVDEALRLFKSGELEVIYL